MAAISLNNLLIDGVVNLRVAGAANVAPARIETMAPHVWYQSPRLQPGCPVCGQPEAPAAVSLLQFFVDF
jgi:hypothetical protein